MCTSKKSAGGSGTREDPDEAWEDEDDCEYGRAGKNCSKSESYEVSKSLSFTFFSFLYNPFSRVSTGSGSKDLKSDMVFAGFADFSTSFNLTSADGEIVGSFSDVSTGALAVTIEGVEVMGVVVMEVVIVVEVVVVVVVAVLVGDAKRGMFLGFLVKNLDRFSPSVSIAVVSDFDETGAPWGVGGEVGDIKAWVGGAGVGVDGAWAGVGAWVAVIACVGVVGAWVAVGAVGVGGAGVGGAGVGVRGEFGIGGLASDLNLESFIVFFSVDGGPPREGWSSTLDFAGGTKGDVGATEGINVGEVGVGVVVAEFVVDEVAGLFGVMLMGFTVGAGVTIGDVEPCLLGVVSSLKRNISNTFNSSPAFTPCTTVRPPGLVASGLLLAAEEEGAWEEGSFLVETKEGEVGALFPAVEEGAELLFGKASEVWGGGLSAASWSPNE
jgi:hypothetical protein